MEMRNDPHTGERFIPQRYNQKFANRENQIQFNNIRARKKRHAKIETDRVLDSNRETLKRLLGRLSEVTKSKDFLLGAGFNFKFFSGLFSHKGVTIYAVYEFQMRLAENGNYLITKK